MSETDEPEELYIFLHVPKCAGTTLREELSLKFPGSRLLPLYSDDKMLGIAVDTNRHDAFRKVDAYLDALSWQQKEKVQIIFGHWVYYGMHRHFPGREARYVTMLRKPAAQAVSTYHFRITTLNAMRTSSRIRNAFTNPQNRIAALEKELLQDGKVIDFASWLQNRGDNPLTQFLFARRFFDAKSVADIRSTDLEAGLNRFYFAGVIESPLDMEFFHYLFGLRYYLRRRNIARHRVHTPTADLARDLMPRNSLDELLYAAAEGLGERMRYQCAGFKGPRTRRTALRVLAGETLHFLSRLFRFFNRRMQLCWVRAS